MCQHQCQTVEQEAPKSPLLHGLVPSPLKPRVQGEGPYPLLVKKIRGGICQLLIHSHGGHFQLISETLGVTDGTLSYTAMIVTPVFWTYTSSVTQWSFTVRTGNGKNYEIRKMTNSHFLRYSKNYTK